MDKETEAARREKTLSESPVDITPKNGGSFPWAGKDADAFSNDWSMKPVEVKGVLDVEH